MSEANRSTILVVDDDPRDRELFRAILERAGYEVAEASSGHEALEALMNIRVDLTILDLTMPEMDGLEVLRATKYMPKSKILVVTGLGSVFGNTMLEAARKLGATATLDKQRAQDLLVPTVRELLGDQT
ncbi:MAG TPA: response regulator [Terriglobia bacterium]|nr:response regulator [Terriglobia bacterium]